LRRKGQTRKSFRVKAKKEKIMNTTHHILSNKAKIEIGLSLTERMLALASRMSEPFWLCLSFVLFLIMGPFSIIAVVYGLWSLASDEKRQKMIEPASC
jgi:hypothetical protein